MFGKKKYSFYVDIECYDKFGKGCWAQERYLVHGVGYVLWTSSIKEAVNFIKETLEQMEK